MIDPVLVVHVACGGVALAAAGVALGAAKGGGLHRRSGRVYVLGMLGVTLTTLALVAARPDPFLLAVGVFSFYLVFSGWRAGVVRDGRPGRPDHVAAAIMAVTAALMLGGGAAGLSAGAGARPVILLAFGAIGLALVLADWRDWRRGPVTGRARIARHLSRMLAGSIATLTAAAVVNLGFLPALVVWLGPTVLLTPVIFWWTARVMRVPASGREGA